MELQARIKEIRKALNLTQVKFAESLGIPKRTLIAYECGQNPIPDRLIISISAVFNVDEHWLRTGEGNMFRKITQDEELAGLFGELLREDAPEIAKIKKKLILELLKLDDQQFESAVSFAKRLFEDKDE